MIESEKYVDALVSKAAASEDSGDAMRFSQAALNVANALLGLRDLPVHDAADLFEAMEGALSEGTPTLALQMGHLWIDDASFDARAILRRLGIATPPTSA